jgi:hypothetical protein
MSTEAIIAIVALIVGLPPTILLLWHCIKKCMGLPVSSESSDAGTGKLADTQLMALIDEGV